MLAQKYLFILLLGLGSGEKIPLDDFVYNDSDLNIAKWRLINSTINNNQTIYKLKITTLKWFDDSLSNNSIWKHDLYITVPNNLNPNNPLFYYIHSAEDDLTDLGYVSNISNKCRCITITIRQIPNQPIKFTDDPSGKGRVEDEIIAWTMRLYLTNERLKFPNKTYENIPLLFPMTKAAKRGMDLAVNFLKIKGYNFTEKFIASGKSKRGWTTWLLTAVDSRVIASVPIVYDIINWNLIIHDQYMSLGGRYSFALEDYFNQNITESIDSLEFYDLRRLIDPLMFLNRYRDKSIYLILTASDEFMMPGNSKYFWRELSIVTETKSYMRRFANESHDLEDVTKIYFNDIVTYINLVNSDNSKKWPKFLWDFGNNKTHGVIIVKLSKLTLFESFELTGYYSKSPRGRDFRKIILNPLKEPKVKEQNIIWNKKEIAINKNITNRLYEYEFAIEKDDSCTNSSVTYSAFYVDASLKFKGSRKRFVVSTDVNFIPEYYPVPDCSESQCFGLI